VRLARLVWIVRLLGLLVRLVRLGLLVRLVRLVRLGLLVRLLARFLLLLFGLSSHDD
jgi:hypothetical protein